jgi:hypothetical protein
MFTIDIDYDARIANEERYRNPKGYDPCFICGRPVNPRYSWWVHLCTDGTLFSTDLAHWADPQSQGAFPVGPECAKRIPRDHRFRL